MGPAGFTSRNSSKGDAVLFHVHTRVINRGATAW